MWNMNIFFIRFSAQMGWEMKQKQGLVLPYIQYWTKRVHLHTTRYKAHIVCTCFHHRKQTNCYCQSCGGCACWHISSVSNPNLVSCRPRQHYKASCCFSIIVLPSKMSFWTRSKAASPAECEENPTMHCSELKYTFLIQYRNILIKSSISLKIDCFMFCTFALICSNSNLY